MCVNQISLAHTYLQAVGLPSFMHKALNDRKHLK